MKKFLMTVAIFAVLFTWSNFVEAKAFTNEQLDRVVDHITEHPASSPDNAKTLKLDAEQLKKNFNAEISPVINKAQAENDEIRKTMEKIFYIDEYIAYSSEIGKLYMNFFGDNSAVFGLTGKDDARFKALVCAYTTPENKNDNAVSLLVFVSFLRTVSPGIDVESFINDISTAQDKPFVRDGVKFTVAREDNLVVLTAVAE